MNKKKICILGLGYIGLPTAAMFATHGSDIVGVENAKRDGIDSFMVYSATKDLDAIVSFYKKHKFKSWYVQMFR